MKKEYKKILKKNGLHPFMYILVHERDRYIIVKNRLTGICWHFYI